MTDLSQTIAPKSDQLNSDDLIGGARTIRITKVSADSGSAEQPIVISYEGDNGHPFKPCKSMRRVLVQVWGKDGNQYTGRSMTLYRDPKVMFGGIAVGGIRISHMSHIDKDVTMALTASRASRKPFTVKPLVVQNEPVNAEITLSTSDYDNCKTLDEFDALEDKRKRKWQGFTPELKAVFKTASDTAKARLTTTSGEEL